MAWQYAIAGAFSLFGAWNRHRQKKKEVEARNRARLNQFYAASNAYVADNIIKDVSWKDEVIQYEIAADAQFQNAANTWAAQDLQVEQADITHAFNVVDILKKRYANEYAGEQTGVSASRLAAEPIRLAGLEITKSVRNVIMAQDTAYLNKEIAAVNADQNIRTAYEQIRRSPIRTHAPQVPDLESGPSTMDFVKDFGLGFASSALSLYAGGLQKGDKLFNFKSALMGGATTLNSLIPGGSTGNPYAPTQSKIPSIWDFSQYSDSGANPLTYSFNNSLTPNLIELGYNLASSGWRPPSGAYTQADASSNLEILY